jgi:hypothetical protein
MSAERHSTGLDRLLGETARLRRSAEDLSARSVAILAERRELFRARPALPASPSKPGRLRPPHGASPTRNHIIDIAREIAQLVVADRHIAEGEARLARQREMIEELRRDGHDTDRAEALLAAFARSLETWRTHRNAIAGSVKWAGGGHGEVAGRGRKAN